MHVSAALFAARRAGSSKNMSGTSAARAIARTRPSSVDASRARSAAGQRVHGRDAAAPAPSAARVLIRRRPFGDSGFRRAARRRRPCASLDEAITREPRHHDRHRALMRARALGQLVQRQARRFGERAQHEQLRAAQADAALRLARRLAQACTMRRMASSTTRVSGAAAADIWEPMHRAYWIGPGVANAPVRQRGQLPCICVLSGAPAKPRKRRQSKVLQNSYSRLSWAIDRVNGFRLR